MKTFSCNGTERLLFITKHARDHISQATKLALNTIGWENNTVCSSFEVFTKCYYCCWHHCAANATVSHVLLNIHSNEKQDGGQVGLSDLNPRCYPEILLRTIRYKALDYSCTKEMTWLDMTIWLDGKKDIQKLVNSELDIFYRTYFAEPCGLHYWAQPAATTINSQITLVREIHSVLKY